MNYSKNEHHHTDPWFSMSVMIELVYMIIKHNKKQEVNAVTE